MLIAGIAIASAHLQNHSLEVFAVFLYWSIAILSTLMLWNADFLIKIRKQKSLVDNIFQYFMWCVHGYVLYLGFTWTIIMLVIVSFVMMIVKHSDYQGYDAKK